MAREPLAPESSFNTANLREDLSASASRFAQSAMQAHSAVPPQWDRFFIDAGTSLEHLAKAYLASIHPSLVVEGRSFGALLHACGRPDLAAIPPGTFRTIGAAEAVQRCIQLLPGQLAGIERELKLLIDTRNGVVHLGLINVTQVTELLLPRYLRAVTELGHALELPQSTLWGDHTRYVAAILSNKASQLERDVAEAITRAQLTFRRRFGDLSDEYRAVILTSITETYSAQASQGSERFNQAIRECPACGQQVLVEGSHNVSWGEEVRRYETPKGTNMYVQEPIVTFFPGNLECRACELTLIGSDALHAAGIEPSALPNVNPWDVRDFSLDTPGVLY